MGSRIRVFDTMPRDVRDQCVGFKARPRSNHSFRGCDDYFDLRFMYRFQPDFVRLLSPQYVLGLRDLYGRNRASPPGQFLSLPKVLTKISYFLYSAITLVSGVRELSLQNGLVCLGR